MVSLRKIALVLFTSLLSAAIAQAQSRPVCDVTCTPDGTSPSYAGAVAARSKMTNARGFGNPLVAKTLPLKVPRTETVVGSQSYNYVIPIVHIPGRAGMDVDLNLYYNSRIWDVDTANNTITFNADRDFPSYGFRLDYGFVEKTGTGLQGSATVTLNDGSKHLLVPGTSTQYDATDGTYLSYNTQTNALYFKNGTIIYYEPFPGQAGQSSPTLFRPTQIRDTNGNYLYFGYLSGHDEFLQTISTTNGQFVAFNYDPNNSHLLNIAQAVQVSPVDPTGVRTYATFTWGTLYASQPTWYSFSGLTVNGAPDVSTAPLNVITQCTYANGTGYRFTYGDWGIITKIENLSSSGATRNYVSYDYPLASAGALTDGPSFTHETVSPDGSSNTSTWIYSVHKAATGIVTSMTVTDPLAAVNDPSGSITVTTLNQSTGLISSVQLQNSSATALRTTGYTWTTSGNGTVPASITTTLNDTGQQSSVQYTYDPNHGNATDIYEYDFGSVLKRHKVTTFTPNVTYHILNLATQVLVKDGTGTTISRTDMAYDQGTLTGITGAANHDDPGHGAAFTARGNLTSITRYANAAAGTGQITRSFTYDTLGNLLTAQLDCCNSKAFNFSSNTQYAYPDSIVRGPGSGPQFTTQYTYNVDKGLVATSVDENGQTTQYQYDIMNRTAAVLLPPQNGTVVQLNTFYDDAAVSPKVITYTTNAANTSGTVTTVDGLGHTLQVDNENCSTWPATCSTVISTTKYVYDKLWRRIQASNPYGPNETPVYTAFAYDSLSRPTQVTPPSAGSTSYTYSGNTVTIADPANKQRKNYSDALGRLTEVDEPGWGDALPGHGSVSVSGAEASMTIDPCAGDGGGCIDPPIGGGGGGGGSCPRTIWDSGTVSITVNGHTDSVPYGVNDTANTVASNLANAVNNDSAASVWAGVSGATITLTARAGGVATNYSVSSSSSTNDVSDFGDPSFAITPSTATLAGGVDGTPQGSPTLARPIVTTYAYNVLDQLTSAAVAAMGPVNGTTYSGQPRTYTYDSLGRVTSATMPESGTVTNYYTGASGNSCANDPTLVCRIVDARGITKTLTYDGVNRPKTVAYSDGTPGVTYAYDNGGSIAFALGRLTSITEASNINSGSNSQIFTYDNLGRITSVTQTIASVLSGLSQSYPVQYSYNLLSELSSITYPSGRVVAQNYDGIGRLCSVGTTIAPCGSGANYLSGLSYNAAGETLGYTMGNGIQGAFSYNDHLQLATLRYYNPLAPSGTADILNFTYDYTSTAQAGNNGQIQAVHYYTQPGVEDQTKSESFSYDAWFRLKAAQTLNVSASTPGTWSLTWAYDRLGNRTQQTLVAGNLPGGIGQPNFTMDQNTNRISGFTYDNAGNLTADTAFTYTYDGANRMTQTQQKAAPNTITTSSYFGPLRIAKINGTPTQATSTTVYIYSGSKPIAEYLNGSLSKEYIYAGQMLLATIAGTSTTYHHPDHISNRAETDSTGNPVRAFGHFPYGETWYESSSDPLKFTSYIRDSGVGESGLDYAIFRQYNPGQARFMSVDRILGDPRAPQSLNRYSYVRNDPANFMDPLGLIWVSFTQQFCTNTGSGDNCVTETDWVWLDDGGTGGPLGFPETSGGGSGGGAGDKRTPNKITCNTVLPNGQTVGGVVNSLLDSIGQNSIDRDATAVLEAQTGLFDPITVGLEVYSGTNFKIMFKGQADPGFLGDAGNFAYGAVSADLGVPLGVSEAVAGAYAWKSGHTDRSNPHGMDDSANAQIPAGYQATCTKP
jgi:RHS repeat-associated protein